MSINESLVPTTSTNVVLSRMGVSMRALLGVEHATTASELAGLLKAAGFVFDQANSGEDTFELARHYDYDIILLEMSLSDISGCELLGRFRRSRITIPVIMLSSCSRPADRAKALALGADDFVALPSDDTELLARIQAVIRRNKGFGQAALTLGPLTLDIDQRAAFVGDRHVHLTRKEYAVLELLVLRKGVPLSKEMFMNHLYGGMDEPNPKIVDVFICKIRKKLTDAGAGGLLATLWGQGYVIRESRTSAAARPRVTADYSPSRLQLC